MKRITQALVAFFLAITLLNFSPSTPRATERGGSIPVTFKSPAQLKPLPSIPLPNIPPMAAIEPVSAPLQPVVTQTPAPAPISSYSGSLDDWLLKLRTCESGGDYTISTGNGFYGAYQFTLDTWNSLGTGYDRADLAPPSIQDSAIITNTNRSSGGLATQNPGCYAKEGLSAFPPN